MTMCPYKWFLYIASVWALMYVMVEAWMQLRRNNNPKLTGDLGDLRPEPNYADDGTDDEDDDDDDEDEEENSRHALKGKVSDVSRTVRSSSHDVNPHVRPPIPLPRSSLFHPR